MMLPNTWPLLLGLSLATADAADSGGGEWPQFRGPNGSGIARSATGAAVSIPVELDPAKAIWRVDIPFAHSSPVIWGDRIYLTAVEGGTRKQVAPGRVVDPDGKLLTICLDRLTGKTLWRQEVPRPRVEVYQPTNSPASPSPVTDGKTVYVFFGDYGILAYDAATGKPKWKLPMGPFNNPNGHGSSPVLVDNLLVLLCDQDNDSFLMAADKNTGKVKWRVARPESTRSYSTPTVFGSGKTAELVVPGAFNLTGYEARTGKKLWWITGMSWQPKSTPLVDGDMIYAHWWESGGENEAPTVTESFEEFCAKRDVNKDKKLAADELDERMRRGFGDMDLNHDNFVDAREWEFYIARRASRNALLAIRHGERGDITNSKSIVWRMQKFLPNVPSPLLYQGVIYLIKDGGILTTVDAKIGAIQKQGRLTGALDTYYASPVVLGDKIYFMSQTGKLSVVKADAQWELLKVNDFGEDSFSTPALAGGRIYVRTRTKLYAF
jgi:outer membrane protein assembly factor BamB